MVGLFILRGRYYYIKFFSLRLFSVTGLVLCEDGGVEGADGGIRGKLEGIREEELALRECTVVVNAQLNLDWTEESR